MPVPNGKSKLGPDPLILSCNCISVTEKFNKC